MGRFVFVLQQSPITVKNILWAIWMIVCLGIAATIGWAGLVFYLALTVYASLPRSKGEFSRRRKWWF